MDSQSLEKNPYFQKIQDRLHDQEDLEKKLNEIRIVKKELLDPIKKPILQGSLDLKKVTRELTLLADAILTSAYFLAKEELRKTFGLPRFKDNDGNYLSGEFSLIGMGKLGAQELHFSSDLDLIFIFNRNGETHGGARLLTNKEYFSKLTQRIISYLTLHTQFGYLYKVDTELRPSGMAGALISPLDPWIAYYHESAQLWEKQALLKARLIFASGEFAKSFKSLFKRLIFLSPFSENFSAEVHHLRMRMEKELAKESKNRWHFKKGKGGLVDIEFTLQYFQLKLGRLYNELIVPNTLDAIKVFQKKKILESEDLNILKGAYDFYRKLEIYLEIHFDNREGFLDPEEAFLPRLAELMGYKNKADFLKRFSSYRDEVRNIYLESLKISSA